ncbi:MAG: amidinotransferase [Flavobacteriaceae bacterium]|nr:amidinotransferase [Bacteroidia bacterium]MBT8286819.1 amidinotransferase [Bacteroidia bacterium]NNF74324.1 amidinotransferase [Flavobacteriaceae bacterium]NNK73066.1 amidinotransferase [Flavobacteriaceae bacterium]
MKQITDTILMIKPTHFRTNEQTAVNNFFQVPMTELDETRRELQEKAVTEFNGFVEKLRNAGVKVIVHECSDGLDTPDAHFPNNWISFHENGVVVLYPMFAENRRLERRESVLEKVEAEGYLVEHVIDYSSAEEEGFFLEGTGSLILDRVNKIAYCALSERADEELFIEFCEDFDYSPVVFTAYQTVEGKRLPIYHTNVMMCVGESFAVICLDSIDNKAERKNVVRHLRKTAKEIIEISENQVHKFAGNMLQVKAKGEKNLMVMSKVAFNSLKQDQIDRIEKYCEILYSDLEVIETCGGGSARCMMAEVFLQKA